MVDVREAVAEALADAEPVVDTLAVEVAVTELVEEEQAVGDTDALALGEPLGDAVDDDVVQGLPEADADELGEPVAVEHAVYEDVALALDVLLGEGLGDTDGVALTDDELLALGELVADGHAV